ncbi:hypothetical protein CEXT_491911 [Caerostris extrusa]|uniref:Uncharacterized protein n=1 Tax=Caerostris extrusa TaxID=172846 RepID=A0AAV4XQV7_CAEEX|nr:hypothetical protein CEXT_491911 [Caerostris extrusa]
MRELQGGQSERGVEVCREWLGRVGSMYLAKLSSEVSLTKDENGRKQLKKSSEQKAEQNRKVSVSSS